MTDLSKSEISRAQYAEGIKRLLKAAPYLDVFYYFGVEPQYLLKEASRPAPRGKEACHTYKEYKRRSDERVSSRPEWVKRFAAALKDTSDRRACFDEFLVYSEFMRQLPKARFSLHHFDELLQRFKAYCTDEVSQKSIDLHSMRVYGICALVIPFMRFSRSVTRKAALAMAEQLEGIIDELQQVTLKNANGIDARFEFKNILVFSYMLACNALKVGLSAHVLSDHLFLFRAISIADWTALPPRLRLQYWSGPRN